MVLNRWATMIRDVMIGGASVEDTLELWASALREGKRRLREIDRRLRFLTNRLAHAEVVEPAAQTQRDRVFFGATVTYYATERDEEVTVTIVGVDEADMDAGKISIGSPVALALLKARRGDEVRVRTPRGPDVLEVIDISYPTA